MDKQDLKIVAEDLVYLRDNWSNGASEAAVRRGSAILRRILVEGCLGQAWRSAGFAGEPEIEGMDINTCIKGHEISQVEFASAGGATNNGITIGGVCHIKRNRTDSIGPEIPAGGPPIPVALRVSNYLEGSCAIVNGSAINRREVIKYMANTRGGVHLGNGRRKSREEKIIQRVSKLENQFNLASMDALFFELLSIGQAVGNSPDIVVLIDKINMDL